MRKVLLVQNEKYLDRALQDVSDLITVEQQHTGKERQCDLLAAIVLPSALAAQLTSEQQTCDFLRLRGSAAPFACDSVSVNGVWLLLTVSQPELPHHISRQESLSRVLWALRSSGCIQSGVSIFPVFPPGADEEFVAEQMEFLRFEHPSLPIHQPLSIRCLEYYPTTSKAGLLTHVE